MFFIVAKVLKRVQSQFFKIFFSAILCKIYSCRNGVESFNIQYLILKTSVLFIILKVDFPLCTRFTLSDSSSWYRTYNSVFDDITLCTLSVAKASSHWKKHIFFISLSFWRLFLSWYFTTVFPLCSKGCWLCLRKGVHLRVPSLFSLTLLSSHFISITPCLSLTHSFAISLSPSVKFFPQVFLHLS